jgi:hypothetical protein
MVHIELKSAAREPAGRPQSRRSDLNGAPTGDIEIDTSAAATDTIDYVATDGQGLTSTSTRTVIVEPAIVPPPSSSSMDATTSATTTIQ